MRLIDADLACKKCGAKEIDGCTDECLLFMGNLPFIDAGSVRHGQWIKADTYRDEDGYICYEYRCSLCDRIVDELESYCPNCGAKMDKEE